MAASAGAIRTILTPIPKLPDPRSERWFALLRICHNTQRITDRAERDLPCAVRREGADQRRAWVLGLGSLVFGYAPYTNEPSAPALAASVMRAGSTRSALRMWNTLSPAAIK